MAYPTEDKDKAWSPWVAPGTPGPAPLAEAGPAVQVSAPTERSMDPARGPGFRGYDAVGKISGSPATAPLPNGIQSSPQAAPPPLAPVPLGATQQFFTMPANLNPQEPGPSSDDAAARLAGIKAEYAGMKAQERQDAIANRLYQDRAMNQHKAWVAANDPRSQFDPDERSRKVSAWLAVNGANAAIGTPQDKARYTAAMLAQAGVGAPGPGGGNQNVFAGDGLDRRNFVDEAMKIQGESRAAIKGVQEGQMASLDRASKQSTLAERQRGMELQQRFMAETDPEKRKVLGEQLLILQGKNPTQDKIAIIELLAGEDALGKPYFRKAAINVETGKIIGEEGGKTGTRIKPTIDEFMKAAKAAPQNKNKTDAELREFYQKQYGGK